MLPPPDAALAHYSDRQSLVTAGAEVAAQMWAEVDPARIVESWTAQVPELTTVLSGAQLGAARSADPYLDEVAAWQDLDPATASPVDARAFAGTASDGRGLASLLMSPAFSALQVIGSGLSTLQALSFGAQHLDTIARTQVADAGRLADGVSLAARRGLDGYVRVVVGKTCSRCILLAGKKYRWNAGFDRHPRCDCVHLPCKLAEHLQVVQDPGAIYRSMTARERQRAGWSVSDQKAMADGADLAQVTNAHRGVYTAGGQKFTREGTTKRGLAGSRLGKRARMTPEQIYAEAGDNRDEALRLLHEHGYLLHKPAMLSRRSLELAASPMPVADLSTMTIPQLREVAKARGVKIPAGSRKADIQGLLGVSKTPVAGGDLSKLTIPKLRELAKERGVAIPSKALKADIVKLLEGTPAKKTATAKKAAAKKVATKPEDLTVAELRALANEHGVYVPASRTTKTDLIARLRMWEAGRDPILPGTAERRAAAVAARAAKAAAEATAKAAADKAAAAALRSLPPSPRNPTVLAGPGGDKWWEPIKDDTGLTAIPIRNLTLDGGSYPYTIASGSAYRVQGVVYVVEDGYAVKMTAEELVRGLWEVHQTLPADGIRHQRAYAWLAGRNPADAYWARQYNMPGFTSAATAGDGGTHVWNRGSRSVDYLTPSGMAGTLRHEFGHNMSGGVHSHGMHDNGQLWGGAGQRDETTSAQVTVVSFGPAAAGHQITMTPDPSRGYPRGVTDYGQSSQAEDFAESMRLYLAGELGVARLTPGGLEAPFYFRDVWPARAAHLDKLLPQVAAEQKSALKRLGR